MLLVNSHLFHSFQRFITKLAEHFKPQLWVDVFRMSSLVAFEEVSVSEPLKAEDAEEM